MTTPGGPRPGALVGRAFLKLGFGEALARVIAFVATVYLARTLGSSLYGVIVIATAVLLYLTFLSDLGVEALGIRDVAAERDRLPATLGLTLGARLLVAILLVVVTVVIGLGVMSQPDGAILAAYAFVLLPAALGTKWVLLGLERAGAASLGRMVTEIVAAVLIIVLVRQPEDLVRAPLAQLLGEGIGAFLLLRLLPSGLARVRARLDPGAIRPLLARSWPIVGHSLLGLAIFNSDFLFLRAFRDSAAVGLYAAAYTLISFFLNLGAAYTMTLLPVITRLRDDPAEAKVLYDGSMAQVMTGALPVAIGGFLVAGGVIDLVFTPAYHASTLPLQVLLWTIPVALIRNVSQSALIGYGRQDQLLHTVAWAAAVNVVLNLALIPRWGMLGAAIATLATEVVRTILAAWYSWRLGLPMTSPRRFVRIALAALTMGLAVWLAGALPVLATIAIGALTYGVALTVLGVLRFRRGALPELAA